MARAKRLGRWRRLLVLLASTAAGGCGPDPNVPGVGRAGEERLEPNIVQVIPRYKLDPFGRTAGSDRTNGFYISALYLAAPGPKGYTVGVFGDGIIHVYMYVIDRTPEGKEKRTLVREWLFDPEQARKFRSRKLTVTGHGYQIHCPWGDADVLDKTVDIEVAFERKDGRVISSLPRRFRVPKT